MKLLLTARFMGILRNQENDFLHDDMDKNINLYRKKSPITYASNIKTPTLILHSQEDYRCPIEQSEQYFVALKRNGKIVEFVRFPDSSHSMLRLGHPKFKSEYLQRTVNWFGEHLTTPVIQG